MIMLIGRYQQQSKCWTRASFKYYTAEMACEITFVSSVVGSEHGGRVKPVRTYAVV